MFPACIIGVIIASQPRTLTMLTYSNFLKARINKYVDVLKNVTMSEAEVRRYMNLLNIYMLELQKVRNRRGVNCYAKDVHAAYKHERTNPWHY